MWDDTVVTDPKDITLANWDITLRKNENVNFTNVVGENAQGAALTFTLTRLWTFHLMQTFLPSCMIMIASVLSVFVPAHLVPGRMGLCITAFLSMISLINGTRYDNEPFCTITGLKSL